MEFTFKDEQSSIYASNYPSIHLSIHLSIKQHPQKTPTWEVMHSSWKTGIPPAVRHGSVGRCDQNPVVGFLPSKTVFIKETSCSYRWGPGFVRLIAVSSAAAAATTAARRPSPSGPGRMTLTTNSARMSGPPLMRASVIDCPLSWPAFLPAATV